MAMGQGGALGPARSDIHCYRDWIYDRVPLNIGQPENYNAELEGR